jgi:hypothetical protein
MGAADFTNIQSGKTMADAFRTAAEQAAWEHGHGYSGTIAEKPGALNFGEAPGRATAKTVQALIHNVDQWRNEGTWTEPTGKCKNCEVPTTEHNGRNPEACGWYSEPTYTTRRTDPRKRAGVVGAFVTDKMVDLYHSKWDAAVGFQLTGKALADYKAAIAKRGGKIPRGHKAWVFMGLASE